jgi:hypothetical protein
MMNKKIFMVFLSFVFSSIAVGADYPSKGIAYYMDFRIELYAGLHEENVDKSGCLYIVKRSDFLKSLVDERPNEYLAKMYWHFDVRAKVVFQMDIPYFISRGGVVRHGDDYYHLDKELFVKSLELLSCPPDFE